MTETLMYPQENKRYAPRQLLFVSVVSFVVSIFFYSLLTTQLQIKPNHIGTTAGNFFFSADVPVYIEKTNNRGWHELSSKHALRMIVWIPMVRSLEVFYNDQPPYERTALAVILFNKICLSLSFTLLSVFTYGYLRCIPKWLIFNGLQLFSVAGLIMIAPDHFSQSYLLLSLSFVLLFLNIPFRVLLPTQLLLGLLIAGTTTTNSIFSALIIVYLLQRRKWLPNTLVTSGYVLGFAGFFLISGYLFFTYTPSNDQELMFNRFFNFQLYRDPFAALEYFLASFTYPIAAPLPRLNVVPIVTYEPIGLLSHSLIDWIIFTLTLLLVVTGIKRSFLTWGKQLTTTALIWLMFNVLFHNIWGDEYMLYIPHFSFLLLLFSLSQIKHLSVRSCALLILPIIGYQLFTLYQVTLIVQQAG